jgi:glycosyltransferase involved in cell wall biosynthesis
MELRASGGASGERQVVVMLLENNTYPEDVRVRAEAESLVRAGHVVRVIAPRGRHQPRVENVRGVEVRRFRSVAGASVSSLLLEYLLSAVALHVMAIRELLRGATVLHLHNPPDILFPAALVARLLGRKVVFDHHDLFPELVSAKFGPGPLVAGARWSERATFAVCNRVLAANESHAEVARSRGGMPAEAVTVVRNGPAQATIQDAPRLREGELSDPQLFYLGAIATQDGVELLADLLVELRDRHGLEGTRLTIVGDGPARGMVEERLRERAVDDQVTITGWVPADSVPELLAGADICIDPAPPTELNHHSTMIKIAEYLAAGKPVAAFALKETVRTADGAARLAPDGDLHALAALVAELARDPQQRAVLAGRALERARDLTWERSEEALLRVYSGL